MSLQQLAQLLSPNSLGFDLRISTTDFGYLEIGYVDNRFVVNFINDENIEKKEFIEKLLNI